MPNGSLTADSVKKDIVEKFMLIKGSDGKFDELYETGLTTLAGRSMFHVVGGSRDTSANAHKDYKFIEGNTEEAIMNQVTWLWVSIRTKVFMESEFERGEANRTLDSSFFQQVLKTKPLVAFAN